MNPKISHLSNIQLKSQGRWGEGFLTLYENVWKVMTLGCSDENKNKIKWFINPFWLIETRYLIFNRINFVFWQIFTNFEFDICNTFQKSWDSMDPVSLLLSHPSQDAIAAAYTKRLYDIFAYAVRKNIFLSWISDKPLSKVNWHKIIMECIPLDLFASLYKETIYANMDLIPLFLKYCSGFDS